MSYENWSTAQLHAAVDAVPDQLCGQLATALRLGATSVGAAVDELLGAWRAVQPGWAGPSASAAAERAARTVEWARRVGVLAGRTAVAADAAHGAVVAVKAAMPSPAVAPARAAAAAAARREHLQAGAAVIRFAAVCGEAHRGVVPVTQWPRSPRPDDGVRPAASSGGAAPDVAAGGYGAPRIPDVGGSAVGRRLGTDRAGGAPTRAPTSAVAAPVPAAIYRAPARARAPAPAAPAAARTGPGYRPVAAGAGTATAILAAGTRPDVRPRPVRGLGYAATVPSAARGSPRAAGGPDRGPPRAVDPAGRRNRVAPDERIGRAPPSGAGPPTRAPDIGGRSAPPAHVEPVDGLAARRGLLPMPAGRAGRRGGGSDEESQPPEYLVEVQDCFGGPAELLAPAVIGEWPEKHETHEEHQAHEAHEAHEEVWR